jgi:hypothetical protein
MDSQPTNTISFEHFKKVRYAPYSYRNLSNQSMDYIVFMLCATQDSPSEIIAKAYVQQHLGE